MVETNIDKEQREGHIILSPNLSARWKTNVYLLYTATIFALAIGLGFASVGLWMILPFTGLELLALVIVVYFVAHKCRQIEVIYFSGEQVKVERGYRAPKSSWQCDTTGTSLVVGQRKHPMHPLRLFLQGRKDQIEIGRFLNDDDKELLVNELQQFMRLT